MYYLLYGFLYLLSLIPWRVLYVVSDGVYLLLYYVIGYRREVVKNNLLLAFPEKTEQERTSISKAFYHNLIDTFIETIKFLSLSERQFLKRVNGNFELLGKLYKTGQSVQLHSGHFFNWEYMNWGLCKLSPYPFIGLYSPIENKAVNRIMFDLRGKYKTILVSTTEFRNRFHQLSQMQYSLGLAADQNAQPSKGYWIKFFGKRTPFVTGPEKGAVRNNTAVVFVHFYKERRGYYHAHFTLVTTQPREFKPGELTVKYVRYLEDCIRKKPANYLWSHRRWKWEHTAEFQNMTFD